MPLRCQYIGMGQECANDHAFRFLTGIADQGQTQQCGDQAFEGIQNQAGDTFFFPDCAQDVGRADVTGTMLADIDSLGAGDDQAERDRAEQEGKKRDEPELPVLHVPDG